MVASRNITDLTALTVPAADDVLLIVERLSATSTEAKKITWANVQEAIQDVVGGFATDSTSINFTYNDVNGELSASVYDNTSTQKTIFNDGNASSTRQEAYFIGGVGLNVVVADDSGNDRANITLKNTGVVSASNNSTNVTGTRFDLISSITTETDGSQSLAFRPLKVGTNGLSAALTDSGESITLDVDTSNININDLDTSTPLAVSTGGTGASTVANARNNLAAAKSGVNSDISSLTGLTTALSVAQGGTGSTTTSDALKNLVGLNSVVHVGASGEALVHNTQTLVSGSYRAELKGVKPLAGNTVTVTTDGSDIAIGANPNNILDAITGSRNINGAIITGSGTPVNDTDLATKAYVLSVAQGLDVKEAVKVATTASLSGTYVQSGQTLTASANGAISLDGVTLSLADRVLVKNQSTGTQNGIYTVTTVGDSTTPFELTRASDFNDTAEVGAAFMFVEQGTTNGSKSFIQSASVPVLDTDDLVFAIFGDSNLPADSIDNAKLSNMVAASIKGRAAGTGTGDPVDLTTAQVISVINAEQAAQINLARVDTTALAFLHNPTFTGVVTIPENAVISGYATTASLSSYATTASLASYATTTSLGSYATTASLSSYATLAAAQTFTAAQRGTIQVLSDNASGDIDINLALANNYQLTLTGSIGNTRNLANPTNVVAGQSGVITIIQSANGSNLLTYGSNWDFSGDAFSISTTANAVDTIAYYVISTTKIRAVLIKD